MKAIPVSSLKYIFWIGLLVLFAGASAGAVSGRWLPVPLAIVLIGAVLMLTALLLDLWTQKGFWQRRSTQAGANVVIKVLSVLVILGLINFLGVRYVNRLDLTENQQFSLAPQSQSVVRNLEQPVKVTVFLQPSSQQAGTVRSLLEQYQRQNRQFSFEIIDPQSNPVLARTYGVTGFGDVFLERGDRRQLLQRVDEFNPLSESKLTNGLEQISRSQQDIAYFLQGHGELPLDGSPNGIAQITDLLKDKNFESKPLNLVEETQVPGDAALVVIAGPQQSLFTQEITALENYLEQGGSLLVMLDPGVQTGLEKLLQEWGVELDDRLVINASDRQTLEYGVSAPVINEYGNHPITQDFGNRFSIYPLARPIALQPKEQVEQVPLLITSDRNWAETNLQDPELSFQPDQGDIPGPLNLGVALSRPINKTTTETQKDSATQATKSPATTSPSPTESPTPESPDSQSPATSETPTSSPQPSPGATTPKAAEPPSASPSPAGESEEKPAQEARMVVIGNSRFATNQLSSQQFLNSDVFLNSVSWLSKRDDEVLSIRPKEVENRRINLTTIQANLIGWTALAVLPLLGFATAGIAWWQRR